MEISFSAPVPVFASKNPKNALYLTIMNLPALNDSIGIYIADINRYPLLSRDEEYRLAVLWKRRGDLDAAHKLVTANLRFVVKIALEYRNYGIGLKDLIQEGNIGLMTAVKKFDPDKGVRLITYAAWWIKSHIQEYILKTKGLVKRGARELKKTLFYRNALSATGADTGADFSLDAPINTEDGAGKTHLERIADTAALQEETIETAQEQTLLKRNVSSALKRLNQKEKLVIEKRILSEEPISLREVGAKLGLTRERVRQIEAAALKKLKGFFLEAKEGRLALSSGTSD